MRPDFEKMDGLVPAVSQDSRTGRVLTLAYQNERAWDRTLATGKVHFWSRSRGELWRKGETSGNTQDVDGVTLDCDRDAVLLLVTPHGPACHRGTTSCFEDPVEGMHRPVLPALWSVLSDRDDHRPEGSWTAKLLDDPELLQSKVQEEAQELTMAYLQESDRRLAEEAADLLYHLLVTLKARGVPPERVLDVLKERMR